jgi:hypothetical protein
VSLVLYIGETGVAAQTCADDIYGAADVVEKMSKFAGFLVELRLNLTYAEEQVITFKEVFGKSKAFIKSIPTIGKVILTVGKGIASLGTKFSKLLEELPTASKLDRIQRRLRDVANLLDTLGNATQAYNAQTTLYQTKLEEYAIVAGEDEGKCLALESCSENDLLEFEGIKALFETCSAVFGPFNGDVIIDVDIETDLDVLNGFSVFIDSVSSWIDELLKDAKETAKEAFCCNNVLRTFAEIFKTALAVVNLVTCFASGIVDSVAGEIIFAVFGKITSLISKVDNQTSTINEMLGALPSGVFETPKELPSADGFDLGTPGICISKFAERTEVDIGEEELFDTITVEDEGNFFDDIGSAIANECTDALEAFNDTKPVNCCDIPRTCDDADPILLFETNYCTFSPLSPFSAGTLSVPEDGLTSTVRPTDDQTCGDFEAPFLGARSLQLLGPIRAGLLIEIGDNTDELCSGDYAAIVLDEDLDDFDDLCVESFEIGNGKLLEKREGYTIHSIPKDGLDGEAFLYVISSGGISTLCSAPTEAPIETKSGKKGKKEKKTKKGENKGVKKEKKRRKRERIVRL